MTNVKQKLALMAATVATSLPALAADDDLGAKAVTEIDKLKPMVAAVGGAFLGVALAIVGYYVIKRIVNRG